MRVLWFTGVQLPALSGQGLTRAGWQEGLRAALETYQPQVELGVAAFGPQARQPLVQGNATYFTLPRPPARGRVARVWNAWQHRSYTAAEFDRCLELVQSFKPDLVHFHGSENFFGLISTDIAVPSLLSIQAVINGLHPFLLADLSWKDILGQVASLEFIKGDGWMHKWLVSDKYRTTEQKILRACQNYIGRTQWDQAMLMAFNPGANYFHCDEILADPFYALEWTGEAAGEAIVYSTTSAAFFKGGLTLARAVAILKQRGWGNVRLHLAGLDPLSMLGRKISALMVEHQLEENIFMLGRLSPQQIAEEMRHAGVYVLPSHMDNSPNSLCEAMLMGMPCIAAAVGGVPSLVRDGVDGWLYHDRDPYMLADKIARALSDRPLAARLGKQARRTALERHDRKTVAGRTVQIYQQVISTGASSA